MSDPLPLLPTTREDAVCALALALRFQRGPAGLNGQRSAADNLMARLAAEHLADTLEAAGYAIGQKVAGVDGNTTPLPFLAP